MEKMKEYIDKQQLIKDLEGSLFYSDSIPLVEDCPTITEAEIRNKAIDECIDLIERREWHDVLELPQILQGLKELKEG